METKQNPMARLDDLLKQYRDLSAAEKADVNNAERIRQLVADIREEREKQFRFSTL